MHDTNMTGSYYTLAHVALFTGLTDRTLRNYLSSGLLQGEKINHLWHFTPEQVDSFLRHPAVRPSIVAKSNSLVYDFLLDTKRATPKNCVILDCPGCDVNELTEFYCSAINGDDSLSELHFSFDSLGGTPRVILTGPTHQVLKMVNCWQEQQLR